MTEDQWLHQVVELAAALGWRSYHVNRSAREVLFRKSGRRAWVSNVNVQGKGFPDLVLVRRRDARIIFAELKTDIGRVDADQRAWLDDLEAVHDYVHQTSTNLSRDAVEVHVWRPRDYDDVERALR